MANIKELETEKFTTWCPVTHAMSMGLRFTDGWNEGFGYYP